MDPKVKPGNGASENEGSAAQRAAQFESDRDRLVAEAKGVAQEAGNVAKQMASTASETLQTGRAKLQGSMSQMRARVEDAQVAAAETARKYADATQAYVVDNPWKALSIAALSGIVLGFLLSRR